ncbi:MAG: D-glycero-alpha-D-manno-heptose-1,7-bisphosphate 7-phosphatase [Thermoguttaceae bacterium]
MGVKALFLDRDGVINEDTGYVYQTEHFHFVDGIFQLCRTAIRKGYIIIVATNQSGIERGYFTEESYRKLTQWMCLRFESEGATITEVLHCPTLSGPDRKPNPGMFFSAQKKYGIDMTASVSLGDKERDIEAARSAGVGLNVLFADKNTESKADQLVATLKEVENLL